MSEFVIIALVAWNIAQYLNLQDLKATLNSYSKPDLRDIPAKRSQNFRVGVTPENLKEGYENVMHRKVPFPKLP